MINLEKKLFDNIKKTAENFSLKELKAATKDLVWAYQKKTHKFFKSDKHRLAYIICRMPATFCSLFFVLEQIKIICPKIKFETALDLGSGPATSAWALFSLFDLQKVHMVEKDKNILTLGEKIIDDLSFSKKIIFEQNDILKIKNYSFDILILSYIANELKNPFIEKIINRWYYSSSKIIVFVEPGTISGYKKINFIRNHLIKKKATIIAPCPNEKPCPILQDDWCHFFVRVKRTKIHKFLKKATLSFEDEKFSYVIATKQKIQKPNARVLSYPIKNKNEITLKLCYDGKIIQKKIIKKDKQTFKKAQKLDWGDFYQIDNKIL